MEVRFEKTEKRNTIISSVILFVMSLCMLFSFWKEKEIAMLIFFSFTLMPFIIKIILLWIFLGKKKNTPYIVLSENLMIVDSFRNGKVEIDLKDILDIKLEEDLLVVYIKGTVHEKKGLSYYLMPNMDNIYQFPRWGKKDEMNDLVKGIKSKIYCTSQFEDIGEFSNLCGSYLFIMAGIPFLFELANLVQTKLGHSVVIFGTVSLVEMCMHWYNDKFLSQAKCDIKTVLRCMGVSAWIAQLIVLSCEIQERILGTQLDVLEMRPELLLPLFGIYLVIFLLYIPENAIGKKLIVFLHNRKTY